MEQPDCYAVLGLPEDADAAAVRRAYRRLARACHPDANPDDPQAAERFLTLAAAYASAGRFDDGVGELDDLRAVAAWARANHPDKILWLAGFSFGAYVSLRLAVELRAAALVSIAPPVGRSWDFSAIEVPTAPWLVIQGEADEIVDPQAVFAWLATLPRQPRLVRMPDTSHFFHRKLIDLRGALKHGVQDWLPAA